MELGRGQRERENADRVCVYQKENSALLLFLCESALGIIDPWVASNNNNNNKNNKNKMRKKEEEENMLGIFKSSSRARGHKGRRSYFSLSLSLFCWVFLSLHSLISRAPDSLRRI